MVINHSQIVIDQVPEQTALHGDPEQADDGIPLLHDHAHC